MENLFVTAKTIQEKRTVLRNLSTPLRGAQSLNTALGEIYSTWGHCDLKTKRQWENEGKRIKEGETALCLWGKPRESKYPSDNGTTGKFYPLCFVYSSSQVTNR